MKLSIVDTGPLVALLSQRDRHHSWARDLFAEIRPPLVSCEAVIAEACFLLQGIPGGSDAALKLASEGVVEIGFSLGGELDPVRRLMKKYANVPMSLADACLVRMTELHPESRVITIDSDFRRYRRNRRQVVPVVMPK